MMERPLYYILDGDTPVPVGDVLDWARLSVDSAQNVIARTYLSRTGDVLPMGADPFTRPADTYALVSTVFLGSDHGYAWLTDDAPPLLFETMVFLGDAASDEERTAFEPPQWRYVTAAQARATHPRIVEQAQGWLRAGQSLADVTGDEWID
jgi:hypothetical protein